MKKRMSRLLTLGLVTTLMGSNVVCVNAADVTATGEKWTQEETADGWVKVTNEGGETLGYSKDSGVALIEQDGYAFKDLDKDGELDVYEDWRETDEKRAADLSSQLTGEEIAPLLTHGGWSNFGSELGVDEEYLAAGGRAGVTRAAGNEGNQAAAVEWTNLLQTYAETNGGHGIPVTISIDPNSISGTADSNGLGATMDTELAKKIAQQNSKDYRSIGVTMLLGPQIDIATQPTWCRTSGTYSEDPALNRDLANAYISGLQSTYDEEGNDLGWGSDSVVAIAKHFAGAGAAEGGRNDHGDSGKYTVYPGGNFAAHLIAFFDGAFNLDSVTAKAGGVMPNYAIAYSEDESLGELVAGAYSEYKINLLRDNNYDGLILTDWQITEDDTRTYGVEDLTEGERFARLFELGCDQIGGTTNVEGALEGYEIMAEDMGEEAALQTMQDHARRFILTQMQVGLYDNPYISTENAEANAWSEEHKEVGKQSQEASIVMLKNSGNTIHAYDEAAQKATVYIPYKYVSKTEVSFPNGAAGAPEMTVTYSWEPCVDVEAYSQYYNVVTDSVGEPTGEDGTYTANDVVRASTEEIAACQYAIVSMENPVVDSTADADGVYYPASIQYSEYTAENAHDAIANGVEIVEISDGYYGTTTQEVKEDRSYNGQTAAAASTYADYEMLQYVDSVVSEDCKVIVAMGMNSVGCMVWSEVEPLADAILMYYNGMSSTDNQTALANIIVGKTEPSALLPMQQPASMDAVENQQEDVPRDVECYVDADGNTYDFSFGLNWSGKIEDERVTTYSAASLTTPETITVAE